MSKQIKGRSVPVYDESLNAVNKALRKLKRVVNDSNTLRECRDRQEYIKPSVKRQRAKAAAIKRHQRKLAKEQLKR